MIINRIDDNVKGGLLMLSCLTFIEEQDMTTSPMFRFYCTARFVGMIINRVDDNVKGGFVIRVSCLATIEDWVTAKGPMLFNFALRLYGNAKLCQD